MRGKYVTLQIILACLAKSVTQKDIHVQLEETIAERKRIMRQLEEFSKRAGMIEMYTNMTKAA